MKKALVFGATGLVGSSLIELLIKDEHYSEVIAFVRNKTAYNSEKIKQIVINIEEIDQIAEFIEGDDLFICLGTTIAKAKSQENFRKVDLYAPVEIAKIASKNGIKNLSVISSIGAKSKSVGSFYLRTKGQMEHELLNLNFENLNIVRPSLLLGKRSEFRISEDFGKVLYKLLSFIFVGKLKKYKGIQAQDVAKAMIYLSKNNQNKSTFESDELQEFSKL